MKDEFNSIKTTVYERLASPLTGSFIISWLIVNWKVVLAILSNEKYINKVAHIHSVYKNAEWPTWIYLFLIPAIAAVVYVCLYQWIIAGSIWIWVKAENAKKMAQSKSILTAKEARILERQVEEGIEENAELHKKNSQLKKELEIAIKERDIITRERDVAIDKNEEFIKKAERSSLARTSH